MPRAAIRPAIDLANTAQPDLVVVTGDLITSERDPLADCVVELRRLRVPLGVWGGVPPEITVLTRRATG
jgi:predicted MPP superfamily phosphohydrolase